MLHDNRMLVSIPHRPILTLWRLSSTDTSWCSFDSAGNSFWAQLQNIWQRCSTESCAAAAASSQRQRGTSCSRGGASRGAAVFISPAVLLVPASFHCPGILGSLVGKYVLRALSNSLFFSPFCFNTFLRNSRLASLSAQLVRPVFLKRY